MRATRRSLNLVLFISFACSGVLGTGSMSHDDKVDILTTFYTSLSQMAHSTIDLHEKISNGPPNRNAEVADLVNSKNRMTYEVHVMKEDHQAMMAEAIRRTGIAEPSQAEATRRGELVEAAKLAVQELAGSVREAKQQVKAVTQQMKTAAISTSNLRTIQEQANKYTDNPDDQITIPTVEETKTRVDEQFIAVQTVIDELPDGDVKTTAIAIKGKLETKLTNLLEGGSAQTTSVLAPIAKEIDALLIQFRQLNIEGTQARMEL